MTTRVQENIGLHKQSVQSFPSVNRLEKAMLSHASFETAGKVLDANAFSGRMAEYLLNQTDCQVCGISDRMEEIRQIRARLTNGDFAYAAIGDIPWQDATFDTILLHPAEGGLPALREQLKECSRVICPGGQLVLGLNALPALLIKAGRLLEMAGAYEENTPSVDDAEIAMESCGFIDIARYPVPLGGCVLVGWRKSEENMNRQE